MAGTVPPPDLVILDLGMPGPPWREAVADIRRLWPEARTVVLTADDSAETAQEALAVGTHGFILKSEEPHVFAAALRLVLSGGIYFPVSVLGHRSASSPTSTRAPRPLHAITERQKEVLGLVAAGCANKEIAWQLKLTEGTVKLHVAAILRALGASNRTQAVSIARGCGLISA